MSKLKIRSRGTDTIEAPPKGKLDVGEPPAEWKRKPEFTDAVKSKDYERLRAKVSIDKNELDTNVEEQLQLYQEVGERASILLSERDLMDEELKRLDSWLADAIRNFAIRNKEPKTVGAVNDEVLQHPLHIARQQEYAAKKAEADLWLKLLNTYEQRAKMLQIETSLYTSGYFMTSVGKTTGTKVRDADAASAREILAQRRQQRKS